MFKNMKVGAKITSGFAIVTLLAIMVGISGYVIISKITHQVEIAEMANIIKENCLEMRRQEKNYIIREQEKDFKGWETTVQKIKTAASKGQKIADDSDIQSWLRDGFKDLNRYVAFVHNLREVILEGNNIDNRMHDAGRAIEAYLKNMEGSMPAITAILDARRQEKNVFLYRHKLLREGEKTYLKKWRDAMATVENWSGADAGLKNLATRYSDVFFKRVKKMEQFNNINSNIIVAARAVIKNADQILDKSAKSMHTAEKTGKTMIMVILGICVLAAIGLAFVIIRGITKPINRVVEGLLSGSDQVAAASGQVSSASQSLAEGAAEQASSIEETSASLEEISSMTKQNADNAGQAKSLQKEGTHAVNEAGDSMSELTTSMEDISKASEETYKIVKTIDEIAFQTNLLALNAAVEAARAGEHGAGFAVVAEEVRNLAIRSADAAKNTSGLIEGTVAKVKNGSELVKRMNEAFSSVVENSSKVGELVGEIAAASQEQAQGIGQINTAVAQMDKVTQQNAANAEESASSSEELNAQAEQMRVFVKELAALVGGQVSGAGGQGPGIKNEHRTSNVQHRMLNRKNKQTEVAAPGAGKVSPDQVIPMEEEDFKDF